MDLFSNMQEEVTAHISSHWASRDGSHSSTHLNFVAPRDFLGRLVTVYTDRFVGSIQSCLGLLANPLFGRDNGERLELSTYMGTVPLRYWLIRENDMPPQDVLNGLGGALEQFARLWVAGPMLPMEQQQGRYTCTANVKYQRVCIRMNARLELNLRVSNHATRPRFKAFCEKALSGITLSQAMGGKGFLRVAEMSSCGSSFELTGDTCGDVTVIEVIREMRELFESAAIGLRLPD